MPKIKSKSRIYISLLIVISLLFSALVVTAGEFTKNEPIASPHLSNEEYKIVNDISNMTGISAEDIVKLKIEGRTWNEVLDKLKYKDASNDREKRNILLAETGLDSEIIARLKADGFTHQEITEAKMLVERVIFQLNEITSENTADAIQFPDESKATTDKEDISSYSDLAAKIDLNTAVYLILKLKKEFGSMENVLDEYLYCLQIGIELNQYLIDEKEYKKIKEEKSVGADVNKIITLAKIQEKLLGKINGDNSRNNIANHNSIDNLPDTTIDPIQDETSIDSIPELPTSEIGPAVPENPTNEVMKEIHAIRDRSLNIGATN